MATGQGSERDTRSRYHKWVVVSIIAIVLGVSTFSPFYGLSVDSYSCSYM
jgi:hypothetical protein